MNHQLNPLELGWYGDPAELIAAADTDPLELLASLLDRIDEPWKRHAACRKPEHRHVDFFPGRGGRSGAAAKAVCHTCPVITECRDYADALGERAVVGVWGGLSGYDRRARGGRGLAAHDTTHPAGPRRPENLSTRAGGVSDAG